MGRYVLLTAATYYYRPQGRRQTEDFEAVSQWARQVDESDGLRWDQNTQNEPTLTRRQRVMVREIVPLEQHAPIIITREVAENISHRAWQQTKLAYQDALRWANYPRSSAESVLGIVLDHGNVGMVELAPLRLLRVDVSYLELVHLAREGVINGEPLGIGQGLQNRFLELTEIIRASPPRRIELLSCRIGVGDRGQALLDWLHFFWGVQVRAYVGDFVAFPGSTGGVGPSGERLPSYGPFAAVVPPDAPATFQALQNMPEPFGAQHSNSIPNDPRLWRTSRNRRPEVTPDATLRLPPEFRSAR